MTLKHREIHCHKMVLATALEMAHELYDTMMLDNLWWAQWQAGHPGASRKRLEELFVKKNLKLLVPQARATLAAMLAQPIDEGLKIQIYDALVLDNQLIRGRKPVNAIQIN